MISLAAALAISRRARSRTQGLETTSVDVRGRSGGGRTALPENETEASAIELQRGSPNEQVTLSALLDFVFR